MSEEAVVVATSTGLGIREQNERQMQDANREAELFINAVPSILIGLDCQGRIKRGNDAAAKTFGLNKADVLGKMLANVGSTGRRNGSSPR